MDTIVDGIVNEEDDDDDEAELLIMSSEADMACQGHMNCDEDIATNQTPEIEWEKDLLASIREGKDNDQDSEGELESTPIVEHQNCKTP